MALEQARSGAFNSKGQWFSPGFRYVNVTPTDFHLVANSYVSVTPLQIDLTHTGQIESLRAWAGR